MFVLLDHMDWLTSHPEILDEEWRWILQTSRDGARIIYRSGGEKFERIPEFASRKLRFEIELTSRLNFYDRVGTYGSFHMARVA